LHFMCVAIGEAGLRRIGTYQDSEPLLIENIIKEEKNKTRVLKSMYEKFKKDKVSYMLDCELDNTSDHIKKLASLNDEYFSSLKLRSDDEIIDDFIKTHDITVEGIGDEEIFIEENYNPLGFYDWLTMGGRFHGAIKLKPGCTGGLGTAGLFDKDRTRDGYDSAVISDIDWDHPEMKDFKTYSFVDHIGYVDMDMFHSKKHFYEEFYKVLKNTPSNVTIYVLDIHS